MDPVRWARIKEVFQAASECEPGRREAVLAELCGGDEPLRAAVEDLLSRGTRAEGFLESPALEVEAMALARGIDPAGDAPGDDAAAAWEEPARIRRTPVDRSSRQVPWVVLFVGTVFLADFLLRTWCYLLGPAPLGIQTRIEGGQHVVRGLAADGSAVRAGLRVGDVLVAKDGKPFGLAANPRVTRANLEIGRSVRFETLRDGRPAAVTVLVNRVRITEERYGGVTLLWQAASAVMLATALLIGFKRPRDGTARLGALMMAALSVGLYRFNMPPGYAAYWRAAPAGLGALLWIPAVCVALVGPIGLSFFARFPRPLFGSRWPWVLAWLPALVLLPSELRTVFLTVYRPDHAHAALAPIGTFAAGTAAFAAYGLAMLAAVTVNYFRLTDLDARRRLHVLIAGGVAGSLPALVRMVLYGVGRRSRALALLTAEVPDTLIAGWFLLFPVSFVYAVLKHRVLGIRVIVGRGIQYALTRGIVFSLVPVSGALLVADGLLHADQPMHRILESRGWLYAAIAALALAVHTQRHRWSRALDRRFFREDFDAWRLLREVAERARHAGSLARAGPGIVARIETALHPEYAALLFRYAGGADFTCLASAPAGHGPPDIAESSPLVARLRAAAAPLEFTASDAGWSGTWVFAPEADDDRTPPAHLLVPIAMGAGRHEAALALGPKRSEAPYSREDLEVLEVVASNLALLLEGPAPSPDRTSGEFEECPQCGACYDTGANRCANEQAALRAVGMPRTLAGRYRLDRRLGRGGMGTVYEAVDTALDRPVAVKVVRDEWVHNAAATRRFRREARAVAGFAHPNVVTVYDYGIEVGSRVYLVMELLRGDTLRDVLAREGRQSAARTLRVLRDVCRAAGAAHERGFIHRDLKPENIFLVEGGGPAKVLDFGVTKSLAGIGDTEAGGAPGTEVGILVGTVGYMSPEQLLGGSPAVSWDLWALAVVAYEMLTASLPFPVESRDAWRQSVLVGRVRPLSAHLDGVAPRVQEFFASAFSADRAERPGSAEEFFRQLERALA